MEHAIALREELSGGAAALVLSLRRTRANNAIINLGAAGDMGVHCGQGSRTVQVIIDVNGYFQ